MTLRSTIGHSVSSFFLRENGDFMFILQPIYRDISWLAANRYSASRVDIAALTVALFIIATTCYHRTLVPTGVLMHFLCVDSCHVKIFVRTFSSLWGFLMWRTPTINIFCVWYLFATGKIYVLFLRDSSAMFEVCVCVSQQGMRNFVVRRRRILLAMFGNGIWNFCI